MSADWTSVLAGALRLAALFTAGLFLPVLLQFLLLVLVGRLLLHLLERSSPTVQGALGLVGVPIHEFSHALAALLTLGRVAAITPLWDASGKATTRIQSGRFRDLIVPAAPLVGGICMLWLTGAYVIPGFQVSSIAPPQFDASAASLGAVASASFKYLGQFLDVVYRQLPHLVWADWRTYVGLYIALSVSIAIAPSSQDLKILSRAVPLVLLLLYLAFLVLFLAGGSESAFAWLQAALAKPLLAVSTAMAAAFLLASFGVVILIPLALWRLYIQA